jgi:hypothetical protein
MQEMELTDDDLALATGSRPTRIQFIHEEPLDIWFDGTTPLRGWKREIASVKRNTGKLLEIAERAISIVNPDYDGSTSVDRLADTSLNEVVTWSGDEMKLEVKNAIRGVDLSVLPANGGPLRAVMNFDNWRAAINEPGSDYERCLDLDVYTWGDTRANTEADPEYRGYFKGCVKVAAPRTFRMETVRAAYGGSPVNIMLRASNDWRNFRIIQSTPGLGTPSGSSIEYTPPPLASDSVNRSVTFTYVAENSGGHSEARTVTIELVTSEDGCSPEYAAAIAAAAQGTWTVTLHESNSSYQMVLEADGVGNYVMPDGTKYPVSWQIVPYSWASLGVNYGCVLYEAGFWHGSHDTLQRSNVTIDNLSFRQYSFGGPYPRAPFGTDLNKHPPVKSYTR